MKTFGITRLCSYPHCRRTAVWVYVQQRFGRRRYAVRLARCNWHRLPGKASSRIQ